VERSINGKPPEERVAGRRKDIAPLVAELVDWMTHERAKLSRHNEVAKATDYMLKRIDVLRTVLHEAFKLSCPFRDRLNGVKEDALQIGCSN
jgi:hypothetical protein